MITDRYPEIAREKTELVLSKAEKHAESTVAVERQRLSWRVDAAERDLDFHQRTKPTDSKLDVFLYQGPKARRDAWDEKLPTLESAVQEAKAALGQWETSIKDGAYEKDLVWKAFSANAPDAYQVNTLVMEADQMRTEFAQDVRQFHELEKALEINLSRSSKKDVVEKRDGLLNKFARDSYDGRLPGRVRAQASKHRKEVVAARELKRSLSRGRDRGFGMER